MSRCRNNLMSVNMRSEQIDLSKSDSANRSFPRTHWHTAASSCLLILVAVAPLLGKNVPQRPAQPWGGAALEDWQNAAKAVVITDLSKCEPQAALTHGVLKIGR